MNPLVQAIQNNNHNQLKLFLDLGHDPNVDIIIDGFKKRVKQPLWFAYEMDDMQCAEILIKAGADPDTILEDAVNSFNHEWCTFILENGADPNGAINEDSHYFYNPYREDFFEEPLHFLSKNHEHEHGLSRLLLELFLKYGADIDSKAYKDRTPIFFAVIDKSFENVEFLLNNGCSLTCTDDEGKGLLHYSAINNFARAAELFISKGLDVNQTDKKGRTPLFDAVYNNSLEVAMLFFSNKVNHELKDKKGRTAAFCLAERSKAETEMADLLISNGVDLDHEDSNGRSILGALVESGKPTLVEYLLQKNIRVRSEERIKGKSLLSYSINKKHFFKQILVLVNHDIQIDVIDSNGNTPLMIAIERKNQQVAIALIKKGANINHCNKKGLNALQLAVQHNEVNVFRELYAHPEIGYRLKVAEVQKMTRTAFKQFSHEAMEILQSKHPEVTIEELNIDKSLCYLLRKNKTVMANFLIKIGADVNVVDENIATPLLYAANNNLYETAQLLIEHGADVNYCNDINITPLIEAAKNNATEVAFLLLENGADIHIVDWEGFTALDHARQRENTKLIVEIEKYRNNQ